MHQKAMNDEKEKALELKKAGSMDKALEAMRRFKFYQAEVEKYQNALQMYDAS